MQIMLFGNISQMQSPNNNQCKPSNALLIGLCIHQVQQLRWSDAASDQRCNISGVLKICKGWCNGGEGLAVVVSLQNWEVASPGGTNLNATRCCPTDSGVPKIKKSSKRFGCCPKHSRTHTKISSAMRQPPRLPLQRYRSPRDTSAWDIDELHIVCHLYVTNTSTGIPTLLAEGRKLVEICWDVSGGSIVVIIYFHWTNEYEMSIYRSYNEILWGLISFITGHTGTSYPGGVTGSSVEALWALPTYQWHWPW